MAKMFSFLLLLGILGGCTSATPVPHYAQSCHGKPWSWCSGYHGNGR